MKKLTNLHTSTLAFWGLFFLFFILQTLFPTSFAQTDDIIYCPKPLPGAPKLHVGLTVTATGDKYRAFLPGFLSSVKKYFFTHHRVSVFVFSDVRPNEKSMNNNEDVPPYTWIETADLGWPYASLRRFHHIKDNARRFLHLDYLFSLDVDLRFVAPVCQDMLGLLVGQLHPCLLGRPGPTCDDPSSAAFIPRDSNAHYYAGGMFGGEVLAVVDMARAVCLGIDKDLAHQPPIIPKWHDESYLNKFFHLHPPTKTLGPEYCFDDRCGSHERYPSHRRPRIVHIRKEGDFHS